MTRCATTVEQSVERAAEARRVGVATNQSTPCAGDRVDRANLHGIVGERVKERCDLLLVRHRDVRPHHEWVGV